MYFILNALLNSFLLFFGLLGHDSHSSILTMILYEHMGFPQKEIPYSQLTFDFKAFHIEMNWLRSDVLFINFRFFKKGKVYVLAEYFSFSFPVSAINYSTYIPSIQMPLVLESFETLKIFRKQSHNAEKKSKGGTL